MPPNFKGSSLGRDESRYKSRVCVATLHPGDVNARVESPLAMFRAFVAIGVAIDLLMAGLLVIVFGWIADSWHDRDPWAGPIVTALWAISLVLSAGAPLLAIRLRRRQATPGRIALAVWLPAILLIGISVIGFILSPAV